MKSVSKLCGSCSTSLNSDSWNNVNILYQTYLKENVKYVILKIEDFRTPPNCMAQMNFKILIRYFLVNSKLQLRNTLIYDKNGSK